MKRYIILLFTICLSLIITGCTNTDYSIKECTVTFITDNDEEILPQIINSGELIKEPKQPTKEGYNFLGWFIESDPWRFSIDRVSADLTLQARWQEITKEDITPIYQGMSANNLSDIKVLNKPKIEKITRDSVIDIIKDRIDVITTDKIEYYASLEENFLITVHVYNPSSFEILSFTLNNYKYQSYEFKEGSTSSELIIEVNAGSISGIKEFTIDAIKYVDKTEIKDVIMYGEKVIKVGVKYLNKLTLNELNETTSYHNFTIDYQFINSTGFKEQNGQLYLFLFNNEELILEDRIDINSTDYFINNLLAGTNYRFLILSIFDEMDGKGVQTTILLDKVISTLHPINCENISLFYNQVSYKISNLVENTNLISASLIHNNTIIKELNGNDLITFTNLNNNTSYEIVLTYEYLLNNKEIQNSLIIPFTTLNSMEPVISLTANSERNTINYTLIKDDPANTILYEHLSLYLNDELVKELDINDPPIITDLYYDNIYTIIYNYSYNLYDNNGIQNKTIYIPCETEFLFRPNVEIVLTEIDKTSLSYGITIEDENEQIISISYNLLSNDYTYLKSGKTFDDLTPYTEYVIEVVFNYTLKDNGQDCSYIKHLTV